MTDLDAIRARNAAATPGPWAWQCWMDPDRFDLPELCARNGYGDRVLAFVPREAVRVVHPDGWEPARVTAAEEVAQELLSDLGDQEPPSITVNAAGERDPNGDLLAYAVRGQVLTFYDRANGRLVDAGGEHAPARWDCYGGQTTAEAGREPYRHNITGFQHPDADFIAHARQDVTDLLAEVDRLQQRLAELEPNTRAQVAQ